MTPHTIQEVEDLILKEFRQRFTLGHTDQIGDFRPDPHFERAEKWLRPQIHKIAAQTLSAVVPEEESSINPKTGMKYYHPENKGMVQGHNNCRQEVLRRGKEFLQYVPRK